MFERLIEDGAIGWILDKLKVRGSLIAGSIEGTPIGAVTPAAGNFTTLTSSAHVCENIALPVPTVSGWSTDPAPLSEITDDDYADLATAGVATTPTDGVLVYDLGETYVVSLAMYIDCTSAVDMQVHFSLDNTTYYRARVYITNGQIASAIGVGRYIKILLYVPSTTQTLSNLSISAIGAPIA